MFHVKHFPRGWFNGRTVDFESTDSGSTPLPRVSLIRDRNNENRIKERKVQDDTENCR